ncbi:hypothetical protein SLEP1_g5838 [Rubroshorea leprosula]|uniref:glucan endo-1,3-beta-D-glucosidase n=1 Tax=Rubroshorea leprosula TaxID=152421 RepID=A0AAV5HZ57_9ROSI|nr:hypothetical protein SLEP1_g5838 [Rubroshorea leprosula]
MSPPSFLFLFLFLLSLLHGCTSLPSIGVTYFPPSTTPAAAASSSRLPAHVAETIDSLRFSYVRLPDSDPALIRAFAYTNISLLLGIPEPMVPALASNRSAALRWIYRHVLPFYPRSKISLISVGNDIFNSSPDVSPFVLPAIRNLRFALVDLGIKKIPVSTTFSFFNIITTAFPPSAAQFQQPAGDLILNPLLQFLENTNSSFLVNLYPYNMYKLNCEIPIGFALFQDHPWNFRDDIITGVRYRNLFDMMVDAVISALAVSGHENVPLIVAETGWPSAGIDTGEVDATDFYAEMYLKGLVHHLKSGLGTPLRKEGVSELYIYELFDGDLKGGSKNWGILFQNMTQKYKVDYSGAGDAEKKNFVALVVFFLVVILGRDLLSGGGIPL